MSLKIKINAFSQKSIQKAISTINNYQKSFDSKVEQLVRELAEIGIPVIDQNVAQAQGDSNKNHRNYINIRRFGSYAQAELILEGRDVLFIEFGAGIHYNGSAGQSPHPMGAEFGYTIGSYGKGNGKKDYWYYYKETGEAKRSYGTEATMPMYHAGEEIRQKIISTARKIFG